MNMKLHVLIMMVCAVSLGCFRHQEAPERPVTATSVEEAEKLGEAVSRIILNGADLKSVPASFASLPKLDTLYLRAAKISDFSGLSQLKGLREIDLSGIVFGKAPEALAPLTDLRRVYLSGCAITDIPDYISKFGNLEYLNLDRNAISAISNSLPASIRWLRLNGNRIASLPDSIGSLTELKRIYLADNRISELPASLSSLVKLEDLNLSGNSLKEFPEVLAKLPSLRNLNLRGNSAIKALPADLTPFKNLRTLILTGCGTVADKLECERIRKALPDCVIIF